VLALHKILEGGEYISASVADELVLHARQIDDRPPHEHLSDREYQVLCLIASGKEVKEISTIGTTVHDCVSVVCLGSARYDREMYIAHDPQ
jgi:hypothetical protein